MDSESKRPANQESMPQYLQLRDVPDISHSSCKDQCTEPHNLTFQHLKEITNSFSDERILRIGIFGVVYKGILQNGETISVKKLVTSKPGFQKQFENECCHLMKLWHPNVLPFVGFCYETYKICMESNGKGENPIFIEMAERLLCSEYQHKGSLDKYLSDESSGFDWQARYKIIEGICYGLHYLQEQTENQPIFLKPASIMLDDYMIPKITDFGISKLFHQEQTKTLDSSEIIGYMAPEYMHGGTITHKSDIFSLGVIILEVITGQRGFPDVSRISSEDFTKLVENKLKTTLEKAQSHTEEEIDCEGIKRCIHIGLLCLNPRKTQRPTTTRIIKMLESTDCHFSNETDTTSSPCVVSAMESPMSYSLGAMGPLLSKLVWLLPPEYRVPKPLKEEIALLKEDLNEISPALLAQSIVQVPNSMAKLWMGEVRELSYDIEDFIEDMMRSYRVTPRFRRRKMRRTHVSADAKARYLQGYRVGNVKIARPPKVLKLLAKIVEFRTLLREESEWYYRNLDGRNTSSRSVFTVQGQVLAPCAKAANYLIGADDTKTKLIELLTDEEHRQLKVVSIFGPAGVGKTTLAKQVYCELGRQFECRAFVRASRKPDMRKLLGGILSQVQQRPGLSDSCTVQDLIDNLTEHLQDKRYFIVIDDLWETTAWNILTSAFPDGSNLSRIVTTAEIEGVGLQSCNYEFKNILKMKPLGAKDSGKLFLGLVFGPEIPCPEHLKEVSDIIISRCSGLPLAIICLSGVLASQADNSELWQHVQQSLCSSLSTNSSLEEALQEILKLSYNSTPHYLKTCLMYLGMYPEGQTIWKVDLVNQWLTEGFISATEGEDTNEVAESYFGELVNRGLIQAVEIAYDGEVLSCTVNHVVLDLITEDSNEEKFITTLDYSEIIGELYGNARRLSLHFSNARFATKPTDLAPSKIRSLAFFGIINCMPSLVVFKLLRVVILEFWGDHRESTSLDLRRVCRLFQIKYLKISCGTSVEVELPTQMQMLPYMETLIIDATVSAVPLEVIHLPGSVRTLHYTDSGSNSEGNVFSLSGLINLQDLRITYNTEKSDEHLNRNLSALASSVVKLVNLKSITLSPGGSNTAVYNDVWSSMSAPPIFLQRLELLPPICIFSRLPEWIGQLRKLCTLKVAVRELLMKDMDTLTGLPALTSLSLYIQQPTAESMIFKRGAFPALKFFRYTCDVLSLAFEEEAFPNLQRLELSFNAHKAEQYECLLSGIQHMLNLKEIEGTIGAAAGAEEPDRRAAESAFMDAIRKHPRFPSYHIVNRADDGEWPHGNYLWKDRHMSDGEWWHRKVTGRGKYSWPSGDTYDGEFKDGFMDGTGTYTGVAGDTYTGSWSMNVKHGDGRMSFANGEQYDGEWRHGKLTGRGKYSWPSGATYDGQFKDGFKDGSGTYTDVAGDTYTGSWSMNLKHGDGRRSYANGDQYDGEFKDGLKDGSGTYTHVAGDTYTGSWSMDLKHGDGRLTYANGEQYDGEWRHEKLTGRGKYSWPSGATYDGEFKDGSRDGAGHYIWRNGSEYIGEWRAGLFDGRGTFSWCNGNSYDGGWDEGYPHGEGKFQWADGSVYVGFWKRDSATGIFQQKGVYYPSAAVSSQRERDPRDVFARELPSFTGGSSSCESTSLNSSNNKTANLRSSSLSGSRSRRSTTRSAKKTSWSFFWSRGAA